MPASDMKELLKHELGDLLYAEQLILKMLGTLTREVNNPEMLARVREHVAETEAQIERLRRAFGQIGEKAKAEKCEAAIGLKEEHDSFKKEKPSRALLEAFDLGSSLRVEHYEIAGYRSAIAVATALGEREVVGLLSESLREEEAMATFIERNAVKALKGLAAGMDLATGAAEVAFTAAGGRAADSRSSTAKRSSGGTAGKSSARKTASKSSGASKTARKSTSKTASKTASRTASKSAGGRPASKRAGKSAAGRSSSSRTTADRSSSGRTSGSKSTGAKSGGGKSGGAKSASKSGSSSRSARSGGGSARA